jgi:hypothetical protein
MMKIINRERWTHQPCYDKKKYKTIVADEFDSYPKKFGNFHILGWVCPFPRWHRPGFGPTFPAKRRLFFHQA